MARSHTSPNLKVKTIFAPSTLVCMLAFSICSPSTTTALPITPSSSTPSAENHSPFRTFSRPITIQIDLNTQPQDPYIPKDNSPLSIMIQRVEQQEQFMRQHEQDPEVLARLEHEQDELEKIEQDRDQELDDEEEEQLDQDPEAVRRRQEESLGLWMSDADFDAVSQGSSSHGCADSEVNKGSKFDLYAEDFKEERIPESKIQSDSNIRGLRIPSRAYLGTDKKNRIAEQPTEEEMLQWPMINLAQFGEDRQDEVQDEFDAYV
ncbi:hypothetical protein BGZ76_006555 [Entomortierella beljakovae]|nr:hypothetical protein BGZ76_006555 [Entomortierella beljakovae]